MRIAFAGFRHGHVMSFHTASHKDSRVSIVAACEEDAPTAANLRNSRQVQLTHDNFERMLSDIDCELVAIGDYFARRGALIISALRAGKHVISDKPICTSLDELDQIELLAREKNLVVSALLDLRDRGTMRTMRELVSDGAIGDVHNLFLAAQHLLLT